MLIRKILVQEGRVGLDEPTDLPNGTELLLVPGEQLEGAQRAPFTAVTRPESSAL